MPGLFHFVFLAAESALHLGRNVLRERSSNLNPLPYFFVRGLTDDPVSSYRHQTPDRRKILTTSSKPAVDQPVSLFSKTRTQSMSLNRIISERDAVSEAREAKTARLREQRLEKEADEMAAAAALAALPKRAGRR
ncbi:hypothetical protein SAMN02927914_02080 [Mesorhizobium qingshengii]|uniref:Uncharacterized protein n=1 Tax=Mesorhizobium qingshengii TaxID=1165689 RepID=A0A1G5XA19_9HYPH|nr:hypothetical protein SAMN02927914_02080 [Mesorhizobium qingshengii]